MVRPLIFILLLSMLFVSGCAIVSTPAPAKTQLPTLEGNWTIKMTHSGGIMGLSRSIEVTSNGMYSVADQRTAQTREGKLSEAELNDLTQLITSIKYSPSKQPSGCADCFIYDIEISGAAKTFTANADDVTLADSGLGPLVMQLRSIMDRELK